MGRASTHPPIALLGLGEAGAALAAGLVAHGVPVFGWDPDPDAARSVPGLDRMQTASAAVAGAEVVLSVNSQRAAVGAAEAVASDLPPGCLYADLNTTSAAVKRAVAAAVEDVGAMFADVALLAPVPGRGLGTPCFVSGAGAARFAAVFGPLGMPVEVIGATAGDAATRKLLRSVFMKGLAAAALESLEAAARAGCEDWLRADIAATLVAADADLLDRLVQGSARHARRRGDEMESASLLERELGVQPHVAEAALAVLRALVDDKVR